MSIHHNFWHHFYIAVTHISKVTNYEKAKKPHMHCYYSNTRL